MQWDIYFDFGKNDNKINNVLHKKSNDFGDTYTHPVHLDISSLQTNWTWYPIDELDGKIPLDQTGKHIHWTEFSDITRVGWRGPIMLWDKLKDLPQIYYD